MRSVIDRLDEKIQTSPGCWEWLAYRNKKGYGRFKLDGKVVEAYRVVYEMAIGPVPNGLHLDHLCRNKGCVNPAHLEAVTQGENTRRGDASKFQSSKTHCPSGHPYDEANTYKYAGRRHCRECARRHRREWYARTTA